MMQEALFEMPEAAGAPLPRAISEMHLAYGAKVDRRCGDCMYFIRYHQSTRWAKCSRTRQTGGSVTEWRAHWSACGLFRDQRV